MFLFNLGLSDPDAKDNCLLALIRQLPKPNFDTTVCLLNHLVRSLVGFWAVNVWILCLISVYLFICYKG